MTRLAAALLATTLCACTTAAASGTAGTDDVQAIIDRWQARTPVPGVVVTLHTDDGQTTWTAGVGSPGESRPMRPSNRFRVASITKLFVATVVMQLVEEGRLDLNAAAGAHLEGLRGVDAGALDSLVKAVTVRHLLAHTSGIPDYGMSDGFAEDLVRKRAQVWSAGQVVALIAGREREFTPGTEHRYSNTNFVLLGEVIRDVTGTTWWEQVRSRILDPLAMDATYIAGFEQGPAAVDGLADLDDDGYEETISGGPWPALDTSEGAAGAIVSTAGDLLTFGRALAGGELLSARSRRLMTTHLPRSPRLAGYGLGAEVAHPDYVTKVWGHGGSLPGYRSLLWHVPSAGVTIAVLTNRYRANPADLAELVMRASGAIP